MKKIFISLNLFILMTVTGLSYGMSELEKEYKSLMEHYNLKLKFAHDNIELAEKDIAGVNELIDLCMKHYIMETCERKYERKLENANRSYQEYKKQRDDILEKKYNLKLRFLEKFGKTPKWWE